MELVDLKVKLREEKGKSVSRKLRATGQIPAIFYGEKIKTVPLVVETKDFTAVVHTEAGANVLLNLKIEGLGKNETAIIKDIQRDPLKDSFLHVDFMKIALDEKITTTVPVTVVGESPGVKEGGVLQHGLWEIEVEALPADLPEKFEVDVSGLDIGDSLRVSDLLQPKGVEILSGVEETVVSVVPPTVVKEEEVVEEELVEPELVGAEAAEEEKEVAEKEEVEKKEEEKEKEKEGEGKGEKKEGSQKREEPKK